MASAVKLKMTGEIRLKKWTPFEAEQVVKAEKGFVWQARVKSGLAFITGFDQFIGEIGEMRWKLLGLFPVMSGTRHDISRSAKDRYAIEHIFLPTALARPSIEWTIEENLISVKSPGLSRVDLQINDIGAVQSVSMQRWGNPGDSAVGLYPFGGFVDEESTWEGCTIPSQLRIGWHFGTDNFAAGEFFRANISHAEFRP